MITFDGLLDSIVILGNLKVLECETNAGARDVFGRILLFWPVLAMLIYEWIGVVGFVETDFVAQTFYWNIAVVKRMAFPIPI